ncbi:hypothetical protein REPUB_Repub04eG0222200 [Reevesia pubescens]
MVMKLPYLGYFLFLVLTLVSVIFVSGTEKRLPILSFDEGYTQLFGDDNLVIHRDGKAVHLSLNERTGSGFVSQDLYLHGYFSASIKLPADYTAGVVVAFYMSNGDMFEKNHDEIDFEFLDNIPIREFKRTAAMGGDFPSKPMSLYATIWDGSDWATNGGKYRVKYKYAPYVAKFSDLILNGCMVDPIQFSSKRCDSPQSLEQLSTSISPSQRSKMDSFRRKHMTYSYCYDQTRYKVPPPECVVNPQESERLKKFDPVTFGGGRRHHGKRHHRSRASRSEADSF